MAQHSQEFHRVITKTVGCKYLLHLPRDDPRRGKGRPLMLFLHGAGERGDDLALVKKHGPPKIVEEGKDLPFVVVSPQCPENQWWDHEVLNALLDEVMAQHAVDADRIYLTGISMGGFATWSLAIAHPERFAAIAPVCGGGFPYTVYRLRHVPVWAFHGAKDTLVPLWESQRMVDALREAGGRVRFTVYPEAGHDAWTETYADGELYEWLLKQRRSARSPG